MSSGTKDSRTVTERDGEKKRRRQIKTDSRGRSPSPESKRGKTEVKHLSTRALFEQEEKEVERRTPEGDLKLHKKACTELRNMMEEIKALKEKKSTPDVEFEEDKIHATLQFVVLKKLNRLGHIRSKKARDETNDAKQKIDQHHLQLQNLLYEASHLQKEITKCLQFKSKDEDINLVPVEDFYKDAPKELSRFEETENDEHKQKLARLEFELEQRKRLSVKRKKAKGYREGIVQDIKTKREYLNSLQPKLNAILQSTSSVQEHLGMPFDEIREQHRTAKFLPQPLYVFYMQASAYKDACDKGLTVSIQGDVDVARAMQESTDELEEDSDSDQEEQEKRSKKRRRGSTTTLVDQKKQKVLKLHPLSILLTVSCKDGSVLHLTFNYLVALEILTVTVKLFQAQEDNTSSVSGGDLLAADSLLRCLYPDDQGDDTPNPANRYVLRSLGLKDFPAYIKEVGRPYRWAQCLGGLQFLDAKGTPQADAGVSASYMEQTITQLRQRLMSRQALNSQLVSFEHSTIPVSKEFLHMFPAKVGSRLTSWKRSTFEDFKTKTNSSEAVCAGLAQETDAYFIGTIDRGSAKLAFHVVISPDYPATSPFFVIDIQWKTSRNNLNDKHVRDMEAEVNIYCDELTSSKSHDQLLTNQIQKLLMCFDVYLETAAEGTSTEGPIEFTKEKVFPRVTRGPDRGKPYVFHGAMGFFAQR